MISAPGARHWTSSGILRACTKVWMSPAVVLEPFQQPRAAAEVFLQGGMGSRGGERKRRRVRRQRRRARAQSRRRSSAQQGSQMRVLEKLGRSSNGESKR